MRQKHSIDYSTIDESTVTKKCCNCLQVKPVKEFHRKSHMSCGYCSRCKPCYRERAREYRFENHDKHLEYQRKFRKKHYSKIPAFRRKWRLKSEYNLSVDEYGKMVENQKGRCAICDCAHIKLVIDHCHKTRVIRGLLCESCNKALGFMKDSAELADKAARYLRDHAV